MTTIIFTSVVFCIVVACQFRRATSAFNQEFPGDTYIRVGYILGEDYARTLGARNDLYPQKACLSATHLFALVATWVIIGGQSDFTT